MKVLSLSLLAAYYGMVSAASTEDFSGSYQELNGCLASFGRCLDETNKFISVHSQATCEKNGHHWVPAFIDASEFQQASDSTLSRFGSDVGLFLVQVPKSLDTASLSGVSLGDKLYCDGEHNYVYADGTTESVQQELKRQGLFGFAVPAKLKIAPYMEDYEFTQRVQHGGKVFTRQYLLAPGAVGRAKEVAAKWAQRYHARRVLSQTENDDAHDLELHFGRHLTSKNTMIEDISDDSKINSIHATAELGVLDDLLNIEHDIMWSEPEIVFSSFNMDASALTQAGNKYPVTATTASNDLNPFWAAGITGKGQVVGIGDSGLDTKHCSFTDPNDALPRTQNAKVDSTTHRKVSQYFSYADTGAGEVGDHGTHVSGSVAGNSLGGVNDHKGMAFDAKIAFFDIGLPGQGGLLVPQNIARTMFPPAYQAGARIHTNSWGGNVNAYTTNSAQVDTFSYENQDFLILYANGNSGDTGAAGSIGTPATAKNCLSVGASMNTDSFFERLGATCDGRVPAGTLCEDSMAVFTSDGPTYDGRIKPDISAPGMFIMSANSETACDMQPKAGTSMATPVTAGNAALVRQFFLEGRYPLGSPDPAKGFTPMGALVKAIFVTSGVSLGGGHGTVPGLQSAPSVVQGFGRAQLNKALFISGNAADENNGISLFVDGDYAKMPTIKATGEKATYEFDINPNAKAGMRATLVWHDPPASATAGKALVNDLDLLITLPSGTKLYPNKLTQADKVNNVERIDIPLASLAGVTKVTLTVTGASVQAGLPQPFALAVLVPLSTAAAPAPGGGTGGNTDGATDGGAGDSTGGDGGATGGVVVYPPDGGEPETPLKPVTGNSSSVASSSSAVLIVAGVAVAMMAGFVVMKNRKTQQPQNNKGPSNMMSYPQQQPQMGQQQMGQWGGSPQGAGVW